MLKIVSRFRHTPILILPKYKLQLKINNLKPRWYAAPVKKDAHRKKLESYKDLLKIASYYMLPVYGAVTGVSFLIFYIICDSGVDVMDLMYKLNMGERLLTYFKHSQFGALTMACFLLKVTAPGRYGLSVILTYALSFQIRKRRTTKRYQQILKHLNSEEIELLKVELAKHEEKLGRKYKKKTAPSPTPVQSNRREPSVLRFLKWIWKKMKKKN